MKPIDMILFCPHCNTQHIDVPEAVATLPARFVKPGMMVRAEPEWTNPPHRTHLCRLNQGGCGWMWRPSDHATNGVLHLASGHPHEMKAPQWEQMAAKRYQETHINPPWIPLSRTYKCGCTSSGWGILPLCCPEHGTPP